MSDGQRSPSVGHSKIDVRIRGVHGGETLYVRMLSDRLSACFTHYVEGTTTKQGRTHYCPMLDDGRCPLCAKYEQAWRGYTPAELWIPGRNFWMPIVLEVTPRLETDLRFELDRGQVWELRRAAKTRKRKNFPTYGTLLETIDTKLLPLPFDPLPVLTRYFNRAPKALNVPNPLPMPLSLELSSGAPPPIPKESTHQRGHAQLDEDSSGGADDKPSEDDWRQFRAKMKTLGHDVPGNDRDTQP